MKQNAFTMSEILIAVAIIGIIAAVSVPLFSDFMPDGNKAKVIKYNDKIKTATNTLLDNEGIYYSAPVNGGAASCVGLECEGRPVVAPYTTTKACEGSTKYSVLIKQQLGIYSYDINHKSEMSDGSHWTITRQDLGQYQITVDSDGTDSGHNCVFSNSCTNPDTFIFNIDKYGRVTPGDAMTDAYLSNATDLRNKKADVALAKTYLSERDYGQEEESGDN